MIRIIDYGMGNLRSVHKALGLLGCDAALTQDPSEVEHADALVLPGVGAFGAAMANLDRLGLTQAILDFAASGRPFLGICLGMQLLLSESYEQGRHTGLGLIPGEVVRFTNTDRNPEAAGIKVPHMGWNTLHRTSDCPLLAGIPDGASVYFIHSYYAMPPKEAVAAITNYGRDFCSLIWSGNIFAAQFHPEKSGAVGLRMLANFASMVSGE